MTQKHIDEGVTKDRHQILKNDIETVIKYRLAAMCEYLSRINSISVVSDALDISNEELQRISEYQEDVQSEFIIGIAEVCRDSRQIEADR